MCWHVSPGFILVILATACGSFFDYKSNKDDFVPVPSLFCGNSVLSGRLGVWLGSCPVSFRITSSLMFTKRLDCNFLEALFFFFTDY